MYKIIHKKWKRHRWWLAETARNCTILTSGKKTFLTLLLHFILISVVNNIHLEDIHAIFTRGTLITQGYNRFIIIIITFVFSFWWNALVVNIFLYVMSCQSTYISGVKISQYPNAFWVSITHVTAPYCLHNILYITCFWQKLDKGVLLCNLDISSMFILVLWYF